VLLSLVGKGIRLLCDLGFWTGCGRPFLSVPLGLGQSGLIFFILLGLSQPVSASEIPSQLKLLPLYFDAQSPFSASELRTQFKLPPQSGGPGSPKSSLPKRLSYQYGYGSDTELNYLKDVDLNQDVRDNSFILVPEFSGY